MFTCGLNHSMTKQQNIAVSPRWITRGQGASKTSRTPETPTDATKHFMHMLWYQFCSLDICHPHTSTVYPKPVKWLGLVWALIHTGTCRMICWPASNRLILMTSTSFAIAESVCITHSLASRVLQKPAYTFSSCPVFTHTGLLLGGLFPPTKRHFIDLSAPLPAAVSTTIGRNLGHF